MLKFNLKVGEAVLVGDVGSDDCLIVHLDKIVAGVNGGQQKAYFSIHAAVDLPVESLGKALRAAVISDRDASPVVTDYLETRRQQRHF